MPPNTLYLGSQVQIIGAAVNMGSATIDMTNAVVSVGSPSSPAHVTTKQYVDTQISNVLSNVDPSAIDSFTEVITAFQTADSNLNGAITSLASSASSALSSEASTARAAELALTNALSAEVARAGAAELALTARIDAINTYFFKNASQF